MNRISAKFITTTIHIILILCLPSLSIALDFPKQKSFVVMDGSCCGGEDSDPHAVHGIQTESGAFVLSGKIIDGLGYEDGFIVKVPGALPDGQNFLHQEEEFNLDWTVKIGKTNKRDGINAAAYMEGAIFAGGYMQNQDGVINGYLVKLNESTGDLIWARSYPSEIKNKESAIEAIIRSADNAILVAGVINADKGTLEGFKSYGNPVSGDAFVMYFSENQVTSKVAPESPIWSLKIKDALAVKHLEELPSGEGFLLAMHGDDEFLTAKVMKISFDGRPIWELDVPNHGELTAIKVTKNGYFLSGHKADRFDGIDASISKISLNGEFLWNKSFGNPKGGDLIFSGLDEGDPRLIYDECWGITEFKNGLVLACGTGIEHCEDLDQDLTSVCESDPRSTWRSNLIHVDYSGNLIWQRASSFVFEGEEDEDIPSTASEWVFTTKSGNLASVVDLSFGVGLEILK